MSCRIFAHFSCNSWIERKFPKLRGTSEKQFMTYLDTITQKKGPLDGLRIKWFILKFHSPQKKDWSVYCNSFIWFWGNYSVSKGQFKCLQYRVTQIPPPKYGFKKKTPLYEHKIQWDDEVIFYYLFLYWVCCRCQKAESPSDMFQTVFQPAGFFFSRDNVPKSRPAMRAQGNCCFFFFSSFFSVSLNLNVLRWPSFLLDSQKGKCVLA